jgi:hypothetical protein
MVDAAAEGEQASASLAEKYRSFLEGLSDDELSLFCESVGAVSPPEVESFGSPSTPARPVVSTPVKIFEITQDVTVNKAKTADKAFNAMSGYIRG